VWPTFISVASVYPGESVAYTAYHWCLYRVAFTSPHPQLACQALKRDARVLDTVLPCHSLVELTIGQSKEPKFRNGFARECPSFFLPMSRTTLRTWRIYARPRSICPRRGTPSRHYRMDALRSKYTDTDRASTAADHSSTGVSGGMGEEKSSTEKKLVRLWLSVQ